MSFMNHSVVSPSTSNNDARGRGRNNGVVHETHPTRGRACLQLRLSSSAKEKMAADFRANVARRDPRFLPAASVQPKLCGQSRRLVRAESSGRRFRRDFRGLAYAGARLAQAIYRLESAAKTRIRRRTNALARREPPAASSGVSRRRARLSEPQAQDLLRA